MSIAFIIMQIGNEQLDQVCEQAIVPAIEACGLQARRVDKHNQGGLLKSEIIAFIQDADIIADLTNERPNCYLEIGYAMGIDKFRNLILTVREDHFPESPDFQRGGPKIHFDLAGYDILAWNPDGFEAFRSELEKRIKRRTLVLTPTPVQAASPWDDNWIEKQRKEALAGLGAANLAGFMELRFALVPPKPDFSQTELNEAARSSTISTFGWPIGVYLGNRDEFRPRPRADGIVAEIAIEDRSSYDYWAIKRSGDFYSLSSLFEDERRPGHIFFNTRIVRAAEGVLYCARLFSRLEVDSSSSLVIAIRYGGLRDRRLSSSNPNRSVFREDSVCAEEEVETVVETTLGQIESDLLNLVKDLTKPLFVLFDFFEPIDSVYEDIVNRFVNGEVS